MNAELIDHPLKRIKTAGLHPHDDHAVNQCGLRAQLTAEISPAGPAFPDLPVVADTRGGEEPQQLQPFKLPVTHDQLLRVADSFESFCQITAEPGRRNAFKLHELPHGSVLVEYKFLHFDIGVGRHVLNPHRGRQPRQSVGNRRNHLPCSDQFRSVLPVQPVALRQIRRRHRLGRGLQLRQLRIAHPLRT